MDENARSERLPGTSITDMLVADTRETGHPRQASWIELMIPINAARDTERGPFGTSTL